jgi:hypothetical protein
MSRAILFLVVGAAAFGRSGPAIPEWVSRAMSPNLTRGRAGKHDGLRATARPQAMSAPAH